MAESDDTSRLLDALRNGRRASDELLKLIRARCQRYRDLSLDDRADLSQECFLRIWERVEDLTNGEALSRLLMGTLRNLVRKRRMDGRRLSCSAELDKLPAPNPDGPTAAHLQEELDQMAERLRLESNERSRRTRSGRRGPLLPSVSLPGRDLRADARREAAGVTPAHEAF